MERKEFIKSCCIGLAVIPFLGYGLQSCSSLHYAAFTQNGKTLTLSKKEFIDSKKGKEKERDFILVKTNDSAFPIGVYKKSSEEYISSLLKCTHRACELNVGGGIYTCPCHGSEFSITGKVLEGPAETDLKTYKTTFDNENIYILLA